MYTLIKLLSGGTYATGIGADWRVQFAAATILSASPTMAGEISVAGSGSGFGVYASYAFQAANPFDQTICISEASAGSPVQVYLNGVLVAEVATPGALTLSAVAGINVLELVRGQAPLVAIPAGALIDPRQLTSRWVSLFAAGSDLFSSSLVATVASTA